MNTYIITHATSTYEGKRYFFGAKFFISRTVFGRFSSDLEKREKQSIIDYVRMNYGDKFDFSHSDDN